MISVESISPSTIRSVWARRRRRLRMLMRNMTRLNTIVAITGMNSSPSRVASATARLPIGRPNMVSMVRSFYGVNSCRLDDQPVAHGDHPVEHGTDARVVGNEHEGLAVLAVEIEDD